MFGVDSVVLQNGVLVISRVEFDTLDPEGVAEIDLATTQAGFHLFFDGSYPISGIRILDNAWPLIIDSSQEVMITISSSGVCSIVHEDLGVTNPEERFRTSTGSPVFFDGRRIQLFWSSAGGLRRWEVPDWSV